MARNRKWLTEHLKFAQADGVDNGDGSISIACTFRTGTAGPNGDKISIGCLARVEGNPMTNSYHLTVRAVHRDMSVATKNCLKAVLA